MKNRNSFLYFDSRSWTTTKVASLSFFLFFFFFRSKKEIDHHLLKMNRGREVKIGGHDRYSINLSRSRAILPRETLIKPRSTDVITVPCSHAGRKAWLMELLPSLPLRLTRKKDILYPFLFLYPAAKWKQPIFLPQLPSSSVFFHRGKRRQKEEKKINQETKNSEGNRETRVKFVNNFSKMIESDATNDGINGAKMIRGYWSSSTRLQRSGIRKSRNLEPWTRRVHST